MKASMIGVAVLVLSIVVGGGCMSPQYQANQSAVNQGVTQAAIGAAIGSAVANNVRDLKDNRLEVILGAAALGGLNGAFNGHQQDQNRAAIGAVAEVASTFIINVNNSNGSVTPVTIRKVGNQFLGPRGEYYNAIPTEQQLKGPYGF